MSMRLQSLSRWSAVLTAVVLSGAVAACGVKTNPDNQQTTPTPTGLTVTDVVPAVGPIGGGQEVQVNGNDFDDGTGVVNIVFGSEPAEIVQITNTSVTVKTPAAVSEGAVNVQVTNAYGTYTLDQGYTYEQTETLYGALSILSLYDILNAGQFSGNPSDFVDAYAAFVEPTAESLLLDLQAADSCELNPSSATTSFTPLDAGSDVEFNSGGATITLTKCTDHTQIQACDPADLSYYPELVIENPSVFAPQSMYDETAVGGSTLDSFNVSGAIATPTQFNVDAPAIDQGTDTSNYYQMSRAADQTFQWSGGTQGDAFFIIISGYDTNAGDYTGQELVCRPNDDGEFTVQSAQISNLTQGDSAVIYMARRVENDWVLSPNSSAGQSVGIIYKIGVVTLTN